ncbi:MAG TPA: hypothetical protein VK742_15015, partial [Candidatus Sulfotelmatobacter sp.]|nr:hypothetical protein [Candidatus Sulfotelmatobacter sp.]
RGQAPLKEPRQIEIEKKPASRNPQVLYGPNHSQKKLNRTVVVRFVISTPITFDLNPILNLY